MRSIQLIVILCTVGASLPAAGQDELRPNLARLGQQIEVDQGPFVPSAQVLGIDHEALEFDDDELEFALSWARFDRLLIQSYFDGSGDTIGGAAAVGETDLAALGRFAMFFAGIGENRFLKQTEGSEIGEIGVNFVNPSGIESPLYAFADNRRVEGFTASDVNRLGVALTSNDGAILGLGVSYAVDELIAGETEQTVNSEGAYSDGLHSSSLLLGFNFRSQRGPMTPLYVVTWASNGSAGDDVSGSSIQARLLGQDQPAGAQFQVNDITGGSQLTPRVATTPDTGFVVTWTSESSAGDDAAFLSIQARRFDPSGTPLGPQFQVNQKTAGFQLSSDVAVAADGSFFVVWRDFTPQDGLSDIVVRGFDSAGAPLGDEVRVNTDGPGEFGDPRIAIAGDVLSIVWPSGTRILLRGTFRRIFADGFEG